MGLPITFTQQENEFLQNLLQQYIYGILRITTQVEQGIHDSIIQKLQAADTV